MIAKLDRLSRNARFLLTVVEGTGEAGVVFCDLPTVPQTRRLRVWVTGTVLPEIRRTGSFGAPAAYNLRDPAQLLALSADLARELRETQATVTTLQADVSALEPRAIAHERIASGAEGSLCPRDGAMRPRR